jgi:carbamoyltransferase
MGKIVGCWNGHDTSVCVLENGIPTLHIELERHSRVKCDKGDSIKLLMDYSNLDDIDDFATCYPLSNITNQKYSDEIKRLGKPLQVIGHHCGHASHAFYSSNFDEALIITIDGGGIENEQNFPSSTTMWHGKGNKINRILTLHSDKLNIGSVWTKCCRFIFRVESGWPYGNQSGTIMSRAGFGRYNQYYLDEFRKFFTSDMHNVLITPPGHLPGISSKDPSSPKHPFLYKWEKLASKSEQNMFDLALALQTATEEVIYSLVSEGLKLLPGIKNICFSGGVSLNSSAIGKLLTMYKNINFYVPAVPYDGGLSIGAAQYVYHHIMNGPRVNWNNNMSPYLGVLYNDECILNTINEFESKGEIASFKATDDEVIQLLLNENIISIYNGRSESGRRALGNRSIICDPRIKSMKDKINFSIKNRSWDRPSAPSILRECVSDYFELDIESPYMSIVLKFKEDMAKKVPAVVHVDGTARLQTVSENDNKWYYSFLKKWYTESGVPALLNTSFNDREPIVCSPNDAIKCFLNTKLDFLYFPSQHILVKKCVSC